MSYPTDIDTFRTKENLPQEVYDPNKKTTIYIEDFTYVEDSVIAIETELGANPKGEFESVAERLDNLPVSTPVSYSDFRSTVNRWYHLGQQCAIALTTVTHTKDILYAYPFIITKEIKAARVGIDVTSGVANAKIRAGIYTNSTTDGCYPDQLICETGEKDASSSALLCTTVNQVLEPGLYWAVSHGGTQNCTVRGQNINYLPAVIGFTNGEATAQATMWQASTAYAALPQTYPSGASATAASIPSIEILTGAL